MSLFVIPRVGNIVVGRPLKLFCNEGPMNHFDRKFNSTTEYLILDETVCKRLIYRPHWFAEEEVGIKHMQISSDGNGNRSNRLYTVNNKSVNVTTSPFNS